MPTKPPPPLPATTNGASSSSSAAPTPTPTPIPPIITTPAKTRNPFDLSRSADQQPPLPRPSDPPLVPKTEPLASASSSNGIVAAPAPVPIPSAAEQALKDREANERRARFAHEAAERQSRLVREREAREVEERRLKALQDVTMVVDEDGYEDVLTSDDSEDARLYA